MAGARRKFDEDSKQGAVQLVRETGKPIAQEDRARPVHHARRHDRRWHRLPHAGRGALLQSQGFHGGTFIDDHSRSISQAAG